MSVIILFIILSFYWLFTQKESQTLSKIKVTRSSIPTPPKEYLTCGNCRGTGQDGFGIMPDSFECEACSGKGYCKIDPNAQYITLSELIERYKVKE